MNENLKVFMEKLSADPELQTEFSQIKDPGEAYALAISVQSGFTKEEFIDIMTELRDYVNEKS